MKRTMLRVLMVVLVLAVVFLATTALRTQAAPGKFKACPKPGCMQPCSITPAPEVLCRNAAGDVFPTSYACCCCGSSSGNSYQRL